MKASEGDERPLEVIHAELVEDAASRFKGRRHDITTNKGVVAFLNEALNAFIIGDGGIIGREELNTVGYLCGIQLKGIAAVQAEENPEESITDILKAGGQVEIRMTREERKAYLTAGSVDGMQRVLQAVKNDGRVIDMELQPDGSFAAPPLAAPPRVDAPMPATTIANAMREGGVDITASEVKQVFGVSLGGKQDDEAVELFGFDDLLDASASTEQALAHLWTSITVENPDLPGVVLRRKRCTKCGITTNDTRKHDGEPCEVFGLESKL